MHSLQYACDAHVLEFVRREAKQGLVEQGLGDPTFVSGACRAAPPIMRYLARALVDGSAAATSLFDDMVTITEEFLANLPRDETSSRPPDTRTQSAVLTAMKLGVLVLHEHLTRTLGTDTLSPETFPRISAALLDVVSPNFIGPDLAGLARAGLERYQQKEAAPPGDSTAEEVTDD